MSTYLVALVDGGGTVPPELGVVRRLVDRGHAVTVLAEAQMAEAVARTGASSRTWSKSPGQFQDVELKSPVALARGMVDHMIAGPAAWQAAEVAAAIDELRPDRVVASFFVFGAMIAAEARGVPFDVLIPNAYSMPAEGLPQFGAGMLPARGPLGRLRDRLARAGATALMDRFALPRLNEARAQFGLARIRQTWDQVHRARRELVLTAAAFDFPAKLGDNVRYVGPVLDDPSWAEADAWTPPPGDDPLVLVALSSTFQDQAACLQRIVDALGTLPVRGLVTLGPALPADAVTAPANVTIVASAPHRQVLQHAAAIVTHGGHGTVMKALAAQVPLVILHHGRDQADNAVRVTTRDAGVAVDRGASSERIAAAVAEVLASERYRDGARKLGAAVAAEAASSALLDELEGER